jgi:AraC-like DNA-binding protein
MVVVENSNGIELIIYYSKIDDQVVNHQSTSTLIFNFSKEYLKAFNGENELILPLKKEKEIGIETELILQEILNTKHAGTIKNMFMESKAIALLLWFIKDEPIKLNSFESYSFLKKPYHREKILKAKDILLANIQSPPTIQQLALQVGINQCYLKKGFKNLFDITIFSFIQEQRIVKAKLLLTQTQEPIANIAERLGFSNSSNFTNAFKNITGLSPSEIRKNYLP